MLAMGPSAWTTHLPPTESGSTNPCARRSGMRVLAPAVKTSTLISPAPLPTVIRHP